MSISQFSQFKDLLAQAVQDTDFVRKNTLLQDSAYQQVILDRIEALTADVSVRQDYTDVISTLGLLVSDPTNRQIDFDPKGFKVSLSAFRESVVSEPRRIFKRATSADGIVYLLADGGVGATGKGVLMLNSSLELVRRLPNFGTDIAAGQYEDPAAAITFTVPDAGAVDIEYVAVADKTHHVVQIYDYATFTHIQTLGTVDMSGADATHFDSPIGLAVDETNERLFVSCEAGQPAGATAANGFVSVWDLTDLGDVAPDPITHVGIPIYYDSTGSPLDEECHTPTDLFYDGTHLWMSNNGDNTVGAFDMSTPATPVNVRFIESAGSGYTLRGPQQLYIRTLTGGFKRLYVVNGNTGTVEEFDADNFTHLKTYGIRASEDELNTYTRMSDAVYGALALPHGVVVDSILIDGQQTNVMVVTDVTNKRVQQFNLDAYTADNFVNFDAVQFDVPVVIDGWNVSGNIPLDMLELQYRSAQTDAYFRTLPNDTTLPATSWIQFRLAVRLDTRKFINSDWHIDHLRVHGKQA